jgi:hypothetical protein
VSLAPLAIALSGLQAEDRISACRSMLVVQFFVELREGIMQWNHLLNLLSEILRFSDKMCPASLYAFRELGLGFPAIAHDNARELPGQNLIQHFHASTLSNNNKDL